MISEIINIRTQKDKSFTTVELLVSMSMILILIGMFLINYRTQGKFTDLSNANHVMLQKIRKAQNLAMAKSTLPNDPTTTPQSYGTYFKTDESCFDIFADKAIPLANGNYDSILSCNVNDVCSSAGNEECIERTFLPQTIQVNRIRIGNPGNYTNCPRGWVNFILSDLSVTIGYSGCSPVSNSREIKIETCIELEDCTLSDNIKTISINNKGMVEIE